MILRSSYLLRKAILSLPPNSNEFLLGSQLLLRSSKGTFEMSLKENIGLLRSFSCLILGKRVWP